MTISPLLAAFIPLLCYASFVGLKRANYQKKAGNFLFLIVN